MSISSCLTQSSIKSLFNYRSFTVITTEIHFLFNWEARKKATNKSNSYIWTHLSSSRNIFIKHHKVHGAAKIIKGFQSTWKKNKESLFNLSLKCSQLRAGTWQLLISKQQQCVSLQQQEYSIQLKLHEEVKEKGCWLSRMELSQAHTKVTIKSRMATSK